MCEVDGHCSDAAITAKLLATCGVSQVALLSRHNAVVQCGAPNLSFLASLPVSEGRLPTHTSTPILDPHAVRVSSPHNDSVGAKSGEYKYGLL